VLAVRVDTTGKHTRWYAGSGIYRHVTLTVANRSHIAHRGVHVSTPRVATAKATVRIQVGVEGVDAGASAGVAATILDPQGNQIVCTGRRNAVRNGARREADLTLRIPKPALWSPESPSLYGLVLELKVQGRVRDRVELTFGIRSISFDAKKGFVLNGRRVKLKGGCVHHDNGPLGSATHDRAEERRVEILKSAGYNAVRTSHNPPSASFLDACDRLGVLVLDEAFDMWAKPKNPEDYHRSFDEWWRADLESMVLRDRNHPSVVAWSIGNEIPERFKSDGVELAARLAASVRRLDPARPVAAAICAGWDEPNFTWADTGPAFQNLDLAGYNYQWAEYEKDHERFPERVIVGTESFPKEAFENWMSVLDHSYVVGDFVWTALDYLGEAGIGRVAYEGESEHYAAPFPWTVAGCGDIDLCGDRKPQSFYRQILWDPKPQVACFVDNVAAGETPYKITAWGWPDERASWTWPGKVGKALTVRVYSNCAAVRLELNGRPVGRARTSRATRYTAEFSVPYQPGELVAVGLAPGAKELCRCALRTAGKPAGLRLAADRVLLRADGQDLCYVSADLVDERGTICPNGDRAVRFSLNGQGRILAVGSGDPCSEESTQSAKRRTFRGRCWAILQASRRQGALTLRATAGGVRAAEVSVSVD